MTDRTDRRTSDAVNHLLRRFTALPDHVPREAPVAATAARGAGTVPTISFASATSNTVELAAADYICLGDSTDATVIQDAIDALFDPAEPTPFGGCELVFFSGTFFLAQAIDLNVPYEVKVRGLGMPTFDCDGGAFTHDVGGSTVKYEGMRFTGGAASAVILEGGYKMTVEDCMFDTITAKACINTFGGVGDEDHYLWVHGCTFTNITLSGGGGVSPRGVIWTDNQGDLILGSVTGCHFENCSGGEVIDFQTGTGNRFMVYGNHFDDVTIDTGEATYFHNWIEGVWQPGDHTSGGAGIQTLLSQVAPFSRAGVLTVAAGTHRFRFPFAATIVSVAATVGTAPTGQAILVDVHKNGTTIFTTQANRPSIAASTNSSAEATPDVTSIAEGDYLTVDVDQIGSGVAGSDLTVLVEWRLV